MRARDVEQPNSVCARACAPCVRVRARTRASARLLNTLTASRTALPVAAEEAGGMPEEAPAVLCGRAPSPPAAPPRPAAAAVPPAPPPPDVFAACAAPAPGHARAISACRGQRASVGQVRGRGSARIAPRAVCVRALQGCRAFARPSCTMHPAHACMHANPPATAKCIQRTHACTYARTRTPNPRITHPRRVWPRGGGRSAHQTRAAAPCRALCHRPCLLPHPT